jgi:hypothetical protein
MPFRIHCVRTCTCAQSLHNDGVGACVAVHRGWGRRSTPATDGEDAVTRNEDKVSSKRMETYLTSTPRWSSSCSGSRGNTWTAVRGHAVWWGIAGRPVTWRWWVAWILAHRIVSGGVGRVWAGVGGMLSLRNRGIYRNITVRCIVVCESIDARRVTIGHGQRRT